MMESWAFLNEYYQQGREELIDLLVDQFPRKNINPESSFDDFRNWLLSDFINTQDKSYNDIILDFLGRFSSKECVESLEIDALEIIDFIFSRSEEFDEYDWQLPYRLLQYCGIELPILKIWESSETKKPKKIFWKKLKRRCMVVLLLIILKREYEWAKKGQYFVKLSLLKRADVAKKMIKDLVYSLSKTIGVEISEIANTPPENIIHPAIANLIIDNKSYKILFETLLSDEDKKRKDSFKNNEEALDRENFNGRRLLIDYQFPTTKVRPNDVFVPKKDFDSNSNWDKDKFYLFLTNKTHDQYREPAEGEKFDRCQVEIDGNGENKMILYIKDVQKIDKICTKEDMNVIKQAEDRFRNFCHPLKYMSLDSSIENIKDTREGLVRINTFLKKAPSYLNTQGEIDPVSDLGGLEKFAKNNLNKDLEDRIAKVRNYIYHRSVNENNKYDYLIEFVNLLSESFRLKLEKLEKDMNCLDYNYQKLSTHIQWQNGNKPQKESQSLLKVSTDYRDLSFSASNISLNLDISDKIYVNCNCMMMAIMLDAIIGNAKKHGFPNSTDKVQIWLSADDLQDEVLLKVCNNGKPIEVSTAYYTTQGMKYSESGNTGIGGWQVNEIVRYLDGRLDIPTENKKFNTEIHIYLPKYGQ